MSVQSYPWTVRIYKGEGRFLIVEEVEHRAGYNTYSDKITIVSEAEDNLVAKLGTEAFLGLKSIEDSPLYVGKPKQFWKNGSKYKGVRLYQNQSYEVYSSEKCREKKGGYNGCIKSINLPANATAEEIGKAIIDVFKAAEEYYERNPMEY